MSSLYEQFWQHAGFAVIGHSEKMSFPRYTYRGLKELKKTVYPIDSSVPVIEGDKTYPDLASLPTSVDAAVIEVPKEETAIWVRKAAEAGIRNVWLHMDTETPEALSEGQRLNLNLLSGSCALMYIMPKRFPHSLHGWIMRRLKKY